MTTRIQPIHLAPEADDLTPNMHFKPKCDLQTDTREVISKCIPAFHTGSTIKDDIISKC